MLNIVGNISGQNKFLPDLAIVSQPSNVTTCEGTEATFSITVTGTNLSYQWQTDTTGSWQNLSNGGDISGANSATLTIANIEVIDEANYRCIVSDDTDSLTSNSASLTVNVNTAITSEPTDQEVSETETATFSLTATGTNLSYQWQSDISGSWQDLTDGGDISGATTNSLSIANAEQADEANYRCVVTGACGSVTSNSVALTVVYELQFTTEETGILAGEIRLNTGELEVNFNYPDGSWQTVQDGADNLSHDYGGATGQKTVVFRFLSGYADVNIIDFRDESVLGDMSQIANCTALDRLYLQNTGVSIDMSTLSTCTALRFLYLQNTNATGDVADISGLTSMLYCYLNDIDIIGDFSAFQNWTSVVSLNIYNTGISGDLSYISGMTSAGYIIAYGASLSDYTDTTLPGSAWDDIIIRIQNNTNLNSSALSKLIIDLDAGGAVNGTLRMDGCNGGSITYSQLSSTAQTAYDNLEGKGWSITDDTQESTTSVSGTTYDTEDTITNGFTGNTIYVTDPGQDQDILANYKAAWDSATNNSMIILPAGQFKASGEVKCGYLENHIDGVIVKGMGEGVNGTRIYRDYTQTNESFIRFVGSASVYYSVEISDIHFKGPDPLTTREIDCLSFGRYKFYVHNCRFSHFTGTINHVIHKNPVDDCVIANNEYIDNYYYDSDDSTYYGAECIVIAGPGGTWPDMIFGSSDFVFIEDNYFSGINDVADGAEAGRYVARYNTIRKATSGHVFQTHPAQPDHIGGPDYYAVSTRGAEIYGNVLHDDNIQVGSDGNNFGFLVGGPTLLWGNTIHDAFACASVLIGAGWADCYGNAPPDYTMPDYPVPYQIGYESGNQYGPSHTGTDPSTHGKGDVFFWNNTTITPRADFTTAYFHTTCAAQEGYLERDRDFHYVAYPNYTPYIYPHPRRTS